MRMWMVDPSRMCSKHLVGEHGEIHKHRHNFVKQHAIGGRVSPIVQIEPEAMQERHDALVPYLKSHNSPYVLPDLGYLPESHRKAKVDQELSVKELSRRCPECRRLISLGLGI